MLLLIPINQFPSLLHIRKPWGLFHHHTNIGFSAKSRGPLLFLICVCEKEASGSDLKHTVTCLATEPLGLLMSAERMWTAWMVGIWYIKLTSHLCCQKEDRGKQSLTLTQPCFNIYQRRCGRRIVYILLINNVIMVINNKISFQLNTLQLRFIYCNKLFFV